MDSPSSNGFRGLSNPELAASITELMGHLNAATRRWLAMLAEFDRRQGWSDSMTQSCAHWLNWQCGIALGVAREKVRVAHALELLPKISAAMECGALSYSKARELTRVATPANEDDLLMVGLHGTASHVAKLVRQYRRVLEVERLSREERQQARRALSYYFDDEDGSLVLKARLPAEAGMLILKALEAALPELPLPREDCEASLHVPCGTSEAPVVQPSGGPKIPRAAQRADALALIAESFLAHGAASLNGGDRMQIVVHIDHETLKERAAGRSEFEEGPGLAAETVRRAACDCSYVKITEDEDGEPLNVGRKTRSIPPALRRALKSRDKGCVFPGCTHTKYVDGHHVKHWANGGETRLGNLVSLCRFHHRLVHEGGVTIERLDDGAWRFVQPDGGSFVSTAPGHTHSMQGDWQDLQHGNEQHDIHIDPHTARTHWRGEQIDYGLAIDILLNRARRTRRGDASAEARDS
jgi:hypothetical protein